MTCSHHLPLTVASKKVAQKLFSVFQSRMFSKDPAYSLTHRLTPSHRPSAMLQLEHRTRHGHQCPPPHHAHRLNRLSSSRTTLLASSLLVVASLSVNVSVDCRLTASPSSPAVGLDLLSPSLGGYNIDVSARWLAINYLHPCQ